MHLLTGVGSRMYLSPSISLANLLSEFPSTAPGYKSDMDNSIYYHYSIIPLCMCKQLDCVDRSQNKRNQL